MKSISILFTLLLLSFNGYTQKKLERVEPPFWWAGMVNPELQLMLYGERIGELTPSIADKDIIISNVSKLENPNYLVIDLLISDQVKAGKFKLILKDGRKTAASYTYELRERAEGSEARESFDQSDVLYLITPDRFANGNPSNDSVKEMRELADRTNKGGRHGGDIKGIADHLDYISDLGFTAIWTNPLLENNMEVYSYHGYSTTDFYKVDPRFGSNEEYKELVDEAHSKDIKVIMDMIVNHNGSLHWWKDDLPSSDWYNYQKQYLVDSIYQNTTHRKSTIQDPYVSQVDLKEFTDGWFVTTMPDLNQRNPYMAKYLIQNSIWWIEYSGIDGIRMDTYPYPDKDFMANWTCAVQNEYPSFNTVGEEWNLEPEIVSYWQQGKVNKDGYTSCLPSLMDFPLQDNLTKGLMGNESSFSGWVDTYITLASDFLYADPNALVTFPDNHDMSRFFTQVNENYDLFKLGITYILTVRGIPQLYYGTEILMTNPGTTDHGIIRSDFPGGWAADSINAFTRRGLTDLQKDNLDFFKTVLNWRKNQPAVHTGKLMHYNPKNGVYVLFRYSEDDKVMVVLSKNSEAQTLNLSRFSEMINGDESGTEILTGNKVQFDGTLIVPAMSPMIIDFD